METLLHKVQAVESEAQQLIETAQQKGSADLQKIQSNEQSVLSETREKVATRADRIIQEQVQKADQEINTIKQQSEGAISTVHEAAQKNHSDALAFAKKLFDTEYLA